MKVEELALLPSLGGDPLCARSDPELFFPEKGGSNRPAKRICSHCEVRGPCLAEALEREEPFGVWGGYSTRERNKMLRLRGQIAA